MAVRKLRSLDEAENGLWMEPSDPRLLPTILQVWATADALAPMTFPRGVYKHRSIEAMNRQTEAWADERIRRAAARVLERARERS